MRLANNIYSGQYRLLNYITTGVFVINKNYEINFWNNNIENWTKIKSEEILNRTLTEFFPHFEQSLYLKLINTVFNDGMTVIFSSELHPNILKTEYNKNQKLQITVLPIPNDENKGYDALFSIEDQTSLSKLISKNRNLNKELRSINDFQEQMIKQRTLELERSNDHLSSLLNSAPVSIILLSNELKIVSINNEGLGYFNVKLDEVFDNKICDFLECEDSIFDSGILGMKRCKDCLIGKTILSTLETGKKHLKVETFFLNRNKDNKKKKHTVLISTSFIKENKSPNVLLIIDDITKQKNIERELIASKNKAEESDKLKSSFLANMSHEIRTPLNGIVGFSDLIGQVELPKSAHAKYAEIISDSSDQLLHQIDSIIDISKIESGQLKMKPDKVSINNIIDSVLSSYKEKLNSANIELNYQKSLPDENCIIDTDGLRLEQILDNLLSNAIKFTPNGKVELGYNYTDKHIEFFVKDNGVGIPKHMHKIIFQRFRQVRDETSDIYRGVGLGLAIARGLVDMLGGKIWLESESNIGSAFYFTIPNKK